MTTPLRRTTLLSLGAALLLSAAAAAPAQARGGGGDLRYERELLRQEMKSETEVQTQSGQPQFGQSQSGQSARRNGVFSDVFGASRDDDDWMFPGDKIRGR